MIVRCNCGYKAPEEKPFIRPKGSGGKRWDTAELWRGESATPIVSWTGTVSFLNAMRLENTADEVIKDLTELGYLNNVVDVELTSSADSGNPALKGYGVIGRRVGPVVVVSAATGILGFLTDQYRYIYHRIEEQPVLK